MSHSTKSPSPTSPAQTGWWNVRTILCVFVVVASMVLAVIEWRRADDGVNVPPHSIGAIVAWVVFYTSLGAVFVYACRQQTRWELLVYIVTLLGEAVLPGFCKLLLSRLPVPSDPTTLEVHLHVVITSFACLVLWAWATILVFVYMQHGKVRWWGRVYLLFAAYCGFCVALWALIDPSGFVGVNAYQQHRYIPHVWPSLVNAPISVCRIVVTIATLFLPIVRTQLEKHHPA